MAAYRRMLPAFGSLADQLSISGPVGQSTAISAAPVDWTQLGTAAIGAASATAQSIWGYHPDPYATQAYGYGAGGVPPGTAVGTLSGVNMNLLILAGLGLAAILVIGSARKSS